MSLINRMLDDLAARQAPGAETLSGVRLNDPMGEANASLNTRTRWILAAIAIVAAALVWFLWPARGAIAVPQPRAAVEPAATTPAPPERVVTAAQPTTVATALTPGLRLESALRSLRAPDAGVARAAAVEERASEDDGDVVIAASAPAAQAPGSFPRPPALRSAPSISAPHAVSGRHAGRSDARNARAKPPPVAEADSLAGDARPLATTTAETSRTATARDALSRGDPATALAVLGPAGSDRDAESAALRAAALQRLGRHREAADAYQGLTQGDPSESGHWVGLAISLEGQQKREEALIAYRRALQSSQLAPSLRAFAQARVTVLEAP